MRRSSCSILTNIAEGSGGRTKPEFRNLLNIAAGSASELHYQFILAKDLFYMNEFTYETFIPELIEIKKMLFTYLEKLH